MIRLVVRGRGRITRKFPREERYGLTSQLRDAAISIPSNIGEGARRKRMKVFLNHQPRIDRVGRMLNGLIGSLQPDVRFWEER